MVSNFTPHALILLLLGFLFPMTYDFSWINVLHAASLQVMNTLRAGITGSDMGTRSRIKEIRPLLYYFLPYSFYFHFSITLYAKKINRTHWRGLRHFNAC